MYKCPILKIMKMSHAEQFLSEVHDFVNETGISPTALGKAAVGDGSIIVEVRNGRSPTLRTVDKITTYMAAERTRRAEAGARRSTAAEALEAGEIAGASELGAGWRARFADHARRVETRIQNLRRRGWFRS